jgi:hypothetical protein
VRWSERFSQENISALYAESRKLIRYDGRVNFITFLTYLHARATFTADLTYYYLLLRIIIIEFLTAQL